MVNMLDGGKEFFRRYITPENDAALQAMGISPKTGAAMPRKRRRVDPDTMLSPLVVQEDDASSVEGSESSAETWAPRH